MWVLAAAVALHLTCRVWQRWEPQREFLGIIGTGDGRECVASRGLLGLEGAWLWELKVECGAVALAMRKDCCVVGGVVCYILYG